MSLHSPDTFKNRTTLCWVRVTEMLVFFYFNSPDQKKRPSAKHGQGRHKSHLMPQPGGRGIAAKTVGGRMRRLLFESQAD